VDANFNNPQNGGYSGVMKYNLNLNSPYRLLSNLQVNFDKTERLGYGESPLTSLYSRELITSSFQSNGETYTTRREIEYNKGAMKINAKTTSPFENFRSTELNYEQSPTSTGFSSNGFYELNGRRYTVQSEYSNTGEEVVYRGSYKTPEQEEYSLNVDHKYNRHMIKTDIAARFGRHGAGSSNFNMDLNTGAITYTSLITTPYTGYERFEIAMNHRGSASNFETMLQ
jgi:hypothetical protein